MSALEHQSPGTILIFTISQKSLNIFGWRIGQRLSWRYPMTVFKVILLLCDGIYPKVKHLVNSMVGNTAKEKLFVFQ
jgi:hypothetical protein